MSMLDWAKREVELACKRENPDRKPGEWDYGCACHESALKALKSLLEDGHSRFSISMTKQILNRLIDMKPLTPIEDTDDNWNYNYVYEDTDGTNGYQCNRMSSLFKDVHPDGSISYHDSDRFMEIDIKSGLSWYNGTINRIMEEVIGPITMPYIPQDEPYRVYREDFLYDPENGDYDTVGLLYYKTPDGERKELNIYLAEKDGELVRITKEEYDTRKAESERRIDK